ncbi:MAG: excinuclease ABC subunit UvrC [Nanoarchaeota archaeon]
MVRFDPPDQPGCYLFKDRTGGIIYVGKAKSLRKRVAQYFSGQPKPIKVEAMVRLIADAEFIVVNNEVEALLLENRLIKQHRPHFNISLKDDKRYAYLELTNERFPRLITTRNPKAKGKLYGPYVDGFARRDVQDLCQRLFKLRTCTTLPKKACLMYHLGRCDAPCEGKIDETHYHENVTHAEQVLRGDIRPVLGTLETQMKVASSATKYETARWCRDAIVSLKRLQQRQSVDRTRDYDEDAIGLATDGIKTSVAVVHVRKGVVAKKSEFVIDHGEDDLGEFLQAYYGTHDVPNKILLPHEVEDTRLLTTWLSQTRGTNVSILAPRHGDGNALVGIATKNAQLRVEDVHSGVVALNDTLNLPRLPRIIEVFDISTTQGTNTVGAMVQFVNGKPNPSGYRKFIIKKAHAQDDMACMREVVGRRYQRLAHEGKDFPDLIVIDGGALQLHAAREAINMVKPGTPIIALAKQLEEIYMPDAPDPLRLPDRHAGLLLLRQARDAVHKFVITFHRLRRGKQSVQSALDTIPGIGPSTKMKLLDAFGSVNGIKNATLDNLKNVVSERVARAIQDALR